MDRTSGCHTPWPGCRSSQQSASGLSCSLGFSANLITQRHTKASKSMRGENGDSIEPGNLVVFQMGRWKKEAYSPKSMLAMTSQWPLVWCCFNSLKNGFIISSVNTTEIKLPESHGNFHSSTPNQGGHSC